MLAYSLPDVSIAHPEIPEKKQNSRDKSIAWQSGLSETIIGAYLMVPLTSIKMLFEEESETGKSYRDFIFRCFHNNYRLFSVRDRSGQRLAVLGISRVNGYWALDFCRDPFDANMLEEYLVYLDDENTVQEEMVPTELYYVSQEIVRLLNAMEIKSH